MKTIARFVTRPSEPSKEGSVPDMIIGSCFRNQNALKSNTVYEIVDIFGELMLREVGKSCLNNKAWNSDINHIITTYQNHLVLTQSEVENIQEAP